MRSGTLYLVDAVWCNISGVGKNDFRIVNYLILLYSYINLCFFFVNSIDDLKYISHTFCRFEPNTFLLKVSTALRVLDRKFFFHVVHVGTGILQNVREYCVLIILFLSL